VHQRTGWLPQIRMTSERRAALLNRARARCTGVMRAQCVHSRRSTVLRFAVAKDRQVYVTTTCGIWKERRSTGRQRRAVSGRNGQVDGTTTTCGIWKERAGRRDDNDVRYLEGTGRSTGRQRRAVSGRNGQVDGTTTTCGIWKERAGRRDDNDVTGSDRST